MNTLSNAAAISKAKLLTLRPEFQVRAKSWLEETIQLGIIPYIYEGFRTLQRQKELYAIGRSLPGKIVTNADVGQSFHNWALAFDWVPLQRVDKAADMYEAAWDDENAYKHGQVIGEKYDLRAVSWETPHLEDAHFANWRDIPKDWIGIDFSKGKL